MEKGTIVLTRFPFTDLRSAKRRPSVIISKTDKNKDDVIVAFISSVIPDKLSETEFVFDISDKGFELTGLKKKSVFKIDKLATLDKSIFSGEIGRIPNYLFTTIIKKLRIAFDINE
jgi:mRNA interferase MazF